MRLLIDTNVILDYILARKGFREDAKRIFELAAYDQAYEFVSSSALTDIFYHVNKSLRNSYETQDKLRELLELISVLDVTGHTIQKALDLHWADFEDAVQYAAALENDVDCIITRNGNDFEKREIPVLSPAEFLEGLDESIPFRC